MADRRQPQPHAASSRFANVETCFSRVPLPPGEGGAKRRVRARMPETLGSPALIRPFLDARPIGLALRAGHLLPEGEGPSRSTGPVSGQVCSRGLKPAT